MAWKDASRVDDGETRDRARDARFAARLAGDDRAGAAGSNVADVRAPAVGSNAARAVDVRASGGHAGAVHAGGAAVHGVLASDSCVHDARACNARAGPAGWPTPSRAL